MRAILSICLLTSLCVFSLSGQIDPANLLFTERFTFEDARGNQDTVYMSGSEQANGTYNPDLGEVNLANFPFDSIFEARIVRTVDIFDFPTSMPFMFKHAIGHIDRFNGGFCRNGITWYAFAVQAKYPPITIRWDTASYQPGGALACYPTSYINNTLAEATIVRWYEAAEPGFVDFACLGVVGEHTFYPFKAPYYHDPKESYIIASIYAGDSLTQDTIDTYPFNIGGQGWLPCAPVIVSESSPADVLINVFPNPVAEKLRITGIEASAVRLVEIYATSGQTVLKQNGQTNEIDVRSLPTGMYYLRIRLSNGTVGLRQFVKR
ncbi:MAG: hypothetical protein ACI81P_001909 [Neolewinella sp.]|jgi:hypothetical protein